MTCAILKTDGFDLHPSGVGARFFLDRYANCGSGYGHAHGRDLSLKAFYVGPLTGMGEVSFTWNHCSLNRDSTRKWTFSASASGAVPAAIRGGRVPPGVEVDPSPHSYQKCMITYSRR